MQIIICKGLPGSGKTTFAREWVNSKPKERVRVNRDDIRRQLGPYWEPQREDLVTQIERDMVRSAIMYGFNVVLDATNFRDEWLHKMVKNMIFTQIDVTYKDFTDVSVEECIKRDSLRPKEEQVGEEVIKRMATKYLNYGKTL